MLSYPYDSIPTTDVDGNVTYDRYVLASTERALNKALFTDGVFANPMGGEVTVSENMTVDVSAVTCQVNGLRGVETAITQWTFDDSDTLDRIDRLVIRGDISTEIRDTFVYIIKGTPAETPVAPDRLTGSMISDIVLADVTIPANSTAISQTKIEDQRLNTDLCGTVTQAITTIDTTTIFNQLQTQVDDNIALIQSAIDETTEGVLQTQIDTNATNITSTATVVSNNVDNITVNAEDISDIEDGTTQVGNSALLDGVSLANFIYGDSAGTINIDTSDGVNNIRKSGFYRVVSGVSIMPFTDYGYLLHMQSPGTAYAMQIVTGLNTGFKQFYTRKLIFSTWSDWTMISDGTASSTFAKETELTDGTKAISVGSVSVGGDDIAITSGSNDNGNWTKFPDGTMIQTMPSVNVPYLTPTILQKHISFPTSFIDTDYTMSFGIIESLSTESLTPRRSTANESAGYIDIHGSGFTSASSEDVDVTITGKWK